MRHFFSYGLNRFALDLAGSGFLSGTLVFLLYLATEAKIVEILGISLFVTTLLSHIITLFILCVQTLATYRDFPQHFMAIVLLCMNLAMATLFLNLSIHF